MGAPEMKQVKAIDVKPYRWALWCSVGDSGKPFENEIVGRKWSPDGKLIWFMLDSHNFYSAAPGEVLELVPLVEESELGASRLGGSGRTEEFYAMVDANDAKSFVQPCPPCPTCGAPR